MGLLLFVMESAKNVSAHWNSSHSMGSGFEL